MLEVPEFIENRIKDVALDLCIDDKLLWAIIYCESGFDRWAVRYEVDFQYVIAPQRYAKLSKVTLDTEVMCQKMSWGLGQVMGGSVRDLGYSGHLTELLDPDTNIFWAGTILKKKVMRWPNLKDHISAYNAGGPSKVNADYVKRVLKALELRDGIGKPK